VIIEQMFALPGIGQLLSSSVYSRLSHDPGNCPVVAPHSLAINLLTDFLYALADPASCATGLIMKSG